MDRGNAKTRTAADFPGGVHRWVQGDPLGAAEKLVRVLAEDLGDVAAAFLRDKARRALADRKESSSWESVP